MLKVKILIVHLPSYSDLMYPNSDRPTTDKCQCRLHRVKMGLV